MSTSLCHAMLCSVFVESRLMSLLFSFRVTHADVHYLREERICVSSFGYEGYLMPVHDECGLVANNI